MNTDPKSADPRPEARAFLKQHPQGLDSNKFDRTGKAAAFVEALYQAGAVQVRVDGLREGGQRATTLVAELPEDPAQRAALFGMYNTEVEQYGESFGGEETDPDPVTERGQRTLTFFWD
ncbi:MAG: hypothetical protein U1A78_19340 [Polyangia bacterium]